MKKEFKHFTAKNLKLLRHQKGISICRLADDMEAKGLVMNQKKLEAYENSRNEPSLTTVKEMATYFQLSVDDFCFTDLSVKERDCG